MNKNMFGTAPWGWCESKWAEIALGPLAPVGSLDMWCEGAQFSRVRLGVGEPCGYIWDCLFCSIGERSTTFDRTNSDARDCLVSHGRPAGRS